VLFCLHSPSFELWTAHFLDFVAIQAQMARGIEPLRSVFYPELVNGRWGDPAFYVRLAHRGSAFLFDCGDIHPLTPREAIKIQALFISHAHIDHMIGFDALLRFFLYRETPLRIYGPEGTIDRIEGHVRGYTWNLIRDYPVRLEVHEFHRQVLRMCEFSGKRGFSRGQKREFPCPDRIILKLPHCLVRALPLCHGDITSLAFALEEPLHIGIHKDALEKHGYRPGPWLSRFKDLIRTHADSQTPFKAVLTSGQEMELPLGVLFDQIAHRERGMKISYVTDVSPSTENMERLIPFIDGSHFLAIEAVFSHQDLDKARDRNHLTAHLAGTIARRGRCARFVTFHHSPRYQDRPDLLDEEARLAFSQTPDVS
jgi:ribonuclease Z